MNRRNWLLTGLVGVLLVAIAFVLLFRPQSERITAVELQTSEQQRVADELAASITELRSVRSTAPELEAQLATGAGIVPNESGLPALLRQLQTAADDAGLVLLSAAPSRPTPVTVDAGPVALHSINLAVELEGRYFQVVDFLRRLEDPAITPRGILWRAASITGQPDTYPLLQVSLQGDVFAQLPVLPEPGVEALPAEAVEGDVSDPAAGEVPDPNDAAEVE